MGLDELFFGDAQLTSQITFTSLPFKALLLALGGCFGLLFIICMLKTIMNLSDLIFITIKTSDG